MIVVAVARPGGPDPAQHQNLVHDGSGLQAQVLLPLQVQASAQQTPGLGQRRHQQRAVAGGAEETEGGQQRDPENSHRTGPSRD